MNPFASAHDSLFLLEGITPLTLTALLLLLLLVQHVRRRKSFDRWRVLRSSAVAVGLLVVARVLPTSVIPTSWVTPLHEGGTMYLVKVLHGIYAHSGPLFEGMKRLLVPLDGALTLLGVVKMNTALWIIAMGLLWCVVRPTLGRLGSFLVVTSFLVAAPLGLHAATSETPAALLWVLFLLIRLAGRLVYDPRSGTAEKRLATALAWLLVVDVGLTRLEFVPIAAGLVFSQRLRSRHWPWRWRKGRRAQWIAPLAVTAIAVGGILLTLVVPDGGDGELFWLLRAWRPDNETWRFLPGLVAALLPPGLVLLVLIGFADSLRRPFETGFLAVLTPLVLLLHANQMNWGSYVLFRYGTMGWPMLALLALIGLRLLHRLYVSHLRENPKSRRIALTLAGLLALTCFAPPLEGVKAPGNHDYPVDVPRPFHLLDRNKQRAARFLIDELREQPDTMVLTRSSSLRHSWPERGKECGPTLFGDGVVAPLNVCKGENTIRQRMREHRGEILCYRGLDSNLRTRDGCVIEPVSEDDVIASDSWPSLPHGNPLAQGFHDDEIRVALFRCDPETLMAFPKLRPDSEGGRCHFVEAH